MLEIIGAEQEMAKQRTTFFRLLFGPAEGFVCIAISNKARSKFTEHFFQYPQELPLMLETIQKNVQNNDLYFCPQLLRERKRTKENVEYTPNAWADLDLCVPSNMLVEPSLIIESSPGRYQAYWVLNSIIDPDDVQDICKRIAYHHREQGADTSGWDLTQLLRIPWTFNHKYSSSPELPTVKVIGATTLKYGLNDFSMYKSQEEYETVTHPMPDFAQGTTGDDLLQLRRMTLNPRIWGMYVDIPEEGKWSQVLWNLEMLLFEAGFSREEVYIIVRDSKCNKYARDGKPAQMLWKDVCRAETKAMIHTKLLVSKEQVYHALLNDEERELVEAHGDTFVERYIKWACSLGDAAAQYHQAGAFVILSSLLSGSVRLPTSFGTIVPNLWFCILADTTLTRKSSSMDLAMDLVMEVDDDLIMATDGSLEGLLTGLSSRPGKPSIFLRDEFSGLLESMSKKDYMAGMSELFTKLYDGKMQKRMLRKEVIEVREPRLILYAGGIKNKITGLLTHEQVSSGFMPRFIFITAESDLNKLKPIGPPTTTSLAERDGIIADLIELSRHYNRQITLHIEKLKTDVQQKLYYDAELTEDAWVRYNILETTLLSIGLKHEQKDIMTPVGDRLAKSILKSAMLLAASRQRTDKVIVEVIDLLKAIKYGEQWRAHAQEIMENVGKGDAERKLELLLRAIERKGGSGISRSELMQMYHLNARDASAAFETLEQRGKITRHRAGRTELLLPTIRTK